MTMKDELWRSAVESGSVRRVEQLLHDPNDATTFPSHARAEGLEFAASHGHGDVLDVLLDATPIDPPHYSALLRLAGFHGHTNTMWRLLKRMRINGLTAGDCHAKHRGFGQSQTHEDETILRRECATTLQAARRGDVVTVRRLLQHDAMTAHAMDDVTGETAFSAAFAGGCRNICEILLEHGAHAVGVCIDQNANDCNHSKSLVRRAVEEGNAPLVRWLLASGANAYTSEIDHTESALSLAVFSSCATEIVGILLSYGAQLNASQCQRSLVSKTWPPTELWPLARREQSMDMTSFWLLAIACDTSNLRLAESLWTTRRDLQDRAWMRECGSLALVLAIHRRHEDMVYALVTRSAITSVKSLRRCMIVEPEDLQWLHGLVRAADANEAMPLARVQSIQCLREMLRVEMATIDTRSTSPAQALEDAIKHGDVDNAIRLISANHVSMSHASVSTCLKTAALQQQGEVLERLLQHPAATARVVQDAFKDACLRGFSDAVALYLAYGVDVEEPICSGTTFLLHQVLTKVGQGHRYALTATHLLEGGANAHILDAFGETPLDILERRRSHIRTSTGKAQLEVVEDVLQQYCGSSYSSRRPFGRPGDTPISSIQMLW